MVRNAASLLLAGILTAVLTAAVRPAQAVVEVRPVRPAPAAADAHPARPVVGGLEAPQGKFPWTVRLSMGCGGALIEPRVVLTAGHCVDGTAKNDSIQVTAGVADLKARGAVTARSERVIRAEGFIDETRGDDWAVVRLDRPLLLPTLPIAKDPVGAGPYVVMGWGQTREDSIRQEERLHYASVPIVPDEKCAVAYKKAGVTLVDDEQICAGSPQADTCQGDSGGPMVGHGKHGEWVQVGIVSWGLGCARDGYPGVYTQLSTFRPAIKAAVRKLR
ncbi:serine protease [Actinoplanes sp. LDG1-06]|uniref:Serine protease n=1 Tax=Paractinoplanes ovalisporus TaxID=2810368 RepID=A0ABS2ARW1_9ACTN|nr:serine protease [Actinoplanes ovalisporus]MBM2622569.1 serine protease [Actinoplanes ovalisporus]